MARFPVEIVEYVKIKYHVHFICLHDTWNVAFNCVIKMFVIWIVSCFLYRMLNCLLHIFFSSQCVQLEDLCVVPGKVPIDFFLLIQNLAVTTLIFL